MSTCLSFLNYGNGPPQGEVKSRLPHQSTVRRARKEALQILSPFSALDQVERSRSSPLFTLSTAHRPHQGPCHCAPSEAMSDRLQQSLRDPGPCLASFVETEVAECQIEMSWVCWSVLP